MIRYPDVLVLGLGRTGTTFVSQILHNIFDICLGHLFVAIRVSGDDRECSYEDAGMFQATLGVLDFYTLDNPYDGQKKPMTSWLKTFSRMHTEQNCKKSLVGMKCAHLARASKDQIIELRPKLIVRTWRSREATVESMVRLRTLPLDFFYERIGVKPQEFWERYYDVWEEHLLTLERTLDIEFVWIRIPEKGSEQVLDEAAACIMLGPYISKLRIDAKQLAKEE